MKKANFRLGLIGGALFCVMLVSVALPSYAEVFRASSDVCRALEQAFDVAGAEYVPGVDVRGKPVVSADVGGDNQQMRMDVVSLPIDIDLAERFDLDLPDGVEMKPTVGRLDIYRDGRVMFDGRDLSDQIDSYCGERARDATKLDQPVKKDEKAVVPVVEPEEKDPSVLEGQAY